MENLRALSRARGRAVDLGPADPDEVRVESARGSTLDIFIASRRGGWVRLQSGRDPEREAEGWLDRTCGPVLRSSLIIVVGAGAGHVLQAIARRSTTSRMLVLEPEAALARCLLGRHDWRPLIESDRLQVLIGPEYEGASEAWAMVGSGQDAPAVLVHPVLERERREAVKRALTVAKRIVFDARANAEARRRFARPYVLNTLVNLPAIVRAGDVEDLTDAFTGVPAILVAAGPSLDRCLPDLGQARDRALIISADTALRPLLEAGVSPHVAVSLDPSEQNADHLSDLPALGRTVLVGEGSLVPRVWGRFADRSFVFRVSDHDPWPWLLAAGVSRGRLRAWGSVLTSAFDLAVRMGCDPIIFVGADLAYTEDRPYCRETTFEQDWSEQVAWGADLPKLWERLLAERHPERHVDVRGELTWTPPHLLAFRDWLVDQCARVKGRQFVNAGGAGILHGDPIVLRALPDVVRELRPQLAADPLGGRLPDSSVRESERRHVLEALDALVGEDLHTEGQPDALINQWMAFTDGQVDRDTVLHALRESLDAFSGGEALRAALHSGRGTSRARHPGVLKPPERAAMLRALWNAHEVPTWVGGPEMHAAGEPDVAGQLEEAERRLAAVLRQSDAVALEAPRLSQGFARVPALQLFQWTQAAQADVEAFEGGLATVLMGLVSELRPVEDFWHRPVLALSAEDADVADEPASPAWSVDTPGYQRIDGLARTLLAVEWATTRLLADRRAGGATQGGLEHAASDADRLLRVVRALGAVVGGEATAAHADTPTAEVALAVDAGRERHTLMTAMAPLASLMRVLTGRLVESRESADVELVAPPVGRGSGARRSFVILRASASGSEPELTLSLRMTNEEVDSAREGRMRAELVAWLEPRILSESGLCRSWMVRPFDVSHVLVANTDLCESYRVREDGKLWRDSTWPRAITGEASWGEKGGALAWFSGGLDPSEDAPAAYVLHRAVAGGEVEQTPLPFRPGIPLLEPGGAVIWPGDDGGLWEWRPGGRVQRLVDGPPCRAVRRIGDRLRLDPVSGTRGQGRRRGQSSCAWTWRPGEKRLTEIPLGSEGPCWASAAWGEWTALAFPESDAVRLIQASGWSVDLTCYYPATVAWAGSSLVVATLEKDVLLFEGLGRWLQDRAPRWSRLGVPPVDHDG